MDTVDLMERKAAAGSSLAAYQTGPAATQQTGSFSYSNYAHALPGPLLTSPASFLGGPLGSASVPPSSAADSNELLFGFPNLSKWPPVSNGVVQTLYETTPSNSTTVSTSPVQSGAPTPESAGLSLADLWVGGNTPSFGLYNTADDTSIQQQPLSPLSDYYPSSSALSAGTNTLPSPAASFNMYHARALSEDQELASLGIAPSSLMGGNSSTTTLDGFMANSSHFMYPSFSSIGKDYQESTPSSSLDYYNYGPSFENTTRELSQSQRDLVPMRVPLMRCASAPFHTPLSPSAVLEDEEDLGFENNMDGKRRQSACMMSTTNESSQLGHLSLPPSNFMGESSSNATTTTTTTAKPRRSRCPSADFEKTFACEVSGCNRMFKRSEHLSRHSRMHSGERPFVCTYPGCGRAFSRSDNLAAHRRRHDKVKEDLLLSKDLKQQQQGQKVGSSPPIPFLSPAPTSPLSPTLFVPPLMSYQTNHFNQHLPVHQGQEFTFAKHEQQDQF